MATHLMEVADDIKRLLEDQYCEIINIYRWGNSIYLETTDGCFWLVLSRYKRFITDEHFKY